MQFTNKHILKITLPVLISLLMEQLIGLTDTAYMGRIGEVELGASALAGVYYLVIFMLGFGFSIGAQVLMARRNGEKNYADIGPVFMQGSYFLMAFAILLFICSYYFSPQILRHIIGSEKILDAAVSYLNWRIYGFFFSFIAVMFRAFYVATTNTRILTINSIVMVLANVVLNYVLIFGKLGLPAMGIAGAAIASSISEAISVLFFIIYTRYKVDYKLYGLFCFHKPRLGALKNILGISIWIMLQEGIVFIGWFIFFITIEHLGERELAVTNVVRAVSSMLFMFVNAFASTASSLVSNMIGAGQPEKVMGLCRRIVALCFWFVIPTSIIIALFPTQFMRIYTDNPEIIAAGVSSLWVMLSSYLICVPAFVYLFCVSGTGNTRMALTIDIVAIGGYVAYMLIVIVGYKANLAVCWTSDHIYYLLTLLAFLYMRYGHWQQKRI